ncbi:MAG: metallophosphoesterase, partial [Candidatus Eremiobacteraeota bacterium]|nr:metallophosphoesterase [Candidatus Eremiobacteraeota bacterium]
LEHTEGKIRFRTAAGTAYPQPAPGSAAAPGPVTDLPPEKLLSTIGYRTARVEERGSLKTVDTMLG